jgi:hypothetical protein
MLKYLWLGLIGGSFIILLAGCSAVTGASGDNPGTLTSGPVSIATDHTTYTPTQGIHVTIKNQSGKAIYALDTRASCTILSLQQQVKGAWQGANVARCPLGRIARQVMIGNGQTYTATIQAGEPAVKNAAFPGGTYRLVLAYATSAGESASPALLTTIYSATLTVAGQAPGGSSTPPAATPSAGTPVSLPPATPKPGQ